MMWKSLADHRDAVGYFADPIRKPSLLKYWWTLAELQYSSVLTVSKRPTEEGFEAAKNSPTLQLWAGDGVEVRSTIGIYSHAILFLAVGGSTAILRHRRPHRTVA